MTPGGPGAGRGRDPPGRWAGGPGAGLGGRGGGVGGTRFGGRVDAKERGIPLAGRNAEADAITSAVTSLPASLDALRCDHR
ncbi:hypothetical protein D5H75_08225 [Bailinhaonella thermotolerans]|uniref:Uncharacterized protein n=1 Tax=Bailinhaonella thermotolerans TaxID=1070861 RepID=A0A3A4B846_9ACTN|nr:hypothetical protein D5H75_08225 [Bailinhaonella thermotolerans]